MSTYIKFLELSICFIVTTDLLKALFRVCTALYGSESILYCTVYESADPYHDPDPDPTRFHNDFLCC
jgi:hypothetical protein